MGDAAGGHEDSRQGWVTGVRLAGFSWTGRFGSGCSMPAIRRVSVTVFGKVIVCHVASIAQMIGVFEEICENRVKLGDLCVLGGRWAGSWGLVWGCGDVLADNAGSQAHGGERRIQISRTRGNQMTRRDAGDFIRPIRTEEEHKEAVARIIELLGAKEGSPEDHELDALVEAVKAYESEVVER